MSRSKRPPLTAEQRKLRSAIANNARWSRVPRSQRPAQTQAARDALRAKYEAQVDPDGALLEDERRELARQARKADLARIALKASRAASARRSASARQAAKTRQAARDSDGDAA